MSGTVHERLRIERERLGWTQVEMAERCEAGRRTVIEWEKGTPIPSNKLEALVQQGMDAQYLLTGVRSANLPAADSASSADSDHASVASTPEEMTRRLAKIPQPAREAIGGVIDAVAEMVGEGAGKRGRGVGG